MSRKQRKIAAAAVRTNQVSCPDPTPAAPASVPGTPEDLRRTYLEKFQPTDDVELDLVNEMISAQWRQRCLALVEDAVFAEIMAGEPTGMTAAFEVRSKTLAALQRSRNNYALQFSRALAELRRLRAKPARTEKTNALTTTEPKRRVVPESALETDVVEISKSVVPTDLDGLDDLDDLDDDGGASPWTMCGSGDPSPNCVAPSAG